MGKWTITALAFCKDSSLLLSGSENGTIKLWNLSTGKTHFSINGHKGKVTSICFSPKQNKFASGGLDGQVVIWDFPSGKQLVALEKRDAAINGIAFSSKGDKIAVAYSDSIARIFVVTSGKILFTLKGHEDAVNSICFSPDGEKIVTGGKDGKVVMWQALSGKIISKIEPRGKVQVVKVQFSQDNRSLYIGYGNGVVQLIDTHNNYLLQTMYSNPYLALSSTIEDIWQGANLIMQDMAISPDNELFIAFLERETRLYEDGIGRKMSVLPNLIRQLDYGDLIAPLTKEQKVMYGIK